jgi:hypothetical protein
MAVVDKLRTLRFLLRVKPEDHSDGFAPVGSLSLRVEQAKITRQMLVIVRSDAVQFGRSILKRRYRHDFPRGLLHYQRSNPHCGTRTFRGRQIGITQATTVYREGGLSYAATAHPPFCDAGSLPADYRARSAELERRAGQTSLLRPDRKPGTRSRYPRALGGSDRARAHTPGA